MDRYRLKNIIILILALVNVFLTGTVLTRERAELTAFRRTEEELGALFAADGMTLEDGAVSRAQPPASVSLNRDTALEERAVVLLLGEGASLSDQGGGLYRWTGGRGEAVFRSSGSFEASGRLAGPEEAESFCRAFCKAFSFQAPELGREGSYRALWSYEGLPVFNCAAVFTLEAGAVTAVSGVLLSSGGTPLETQQPPLSAAGALTAFQQMRRESTAVASSVSDTQLCYELLSSGAAPSLTPAWRIVTDTTDYYVNCVTGAVTAG